MKTSSLGDIVQCFSVLDYLHNLFPESAIDWVVSKEHVSLVASHPLIRRAIVLDLRELAASFRSLRRFSYDVIFDLQGNCKSGLVTWMARSKHKVGYAFHSVREWPNIFFTNCRFEVSRNQNIRLFYLELVQKFFADLKPYEICKRILCIEDGDKLQIHQILAAGLLQGKRKVMVCPGSKWKNKQLPIETWSQFLLKLAAYLDASFLLVWGSEKEREDCEFLKEALGNRSILVGKLNISAWQNLMLAMDLVLAVDSSALHLCGSTATPSFSIFGPTSSSVFLPLGSSHFAIQGTCPYGKIFLKQCPVLRHCATGACIRNLQADAIFEVFEKWWAASQNLSV